MSPRGGNPRNNYEWNIQHRNCVMYSGFDQNISHQQKRSHEHADIYFILINFPSFVLNLTVRCVAFEMWGPPRRIIFRKRRESGIKDESDKALLLSLSTWNFFDGQAGWTILDQTCFLNFFVGPLLHVLMMFLLKMVNYSMSFLSLSTSIFFWRTSRGDHSGPFLFSELFCRTAPSCLKVIGGWWPPRF